MIPAGAFVVAVVVYLGLAVVVGRICGMGDDS